MVYRKGDPIDIATQGLLSEDPITIYSQGLLELEAVDADIIVNGGAVVSVTLTYGATGGLVIDDGEAGTEITVTYEPAGGITLAGAADTEITLNVTGDGGLVTGGAADIEITVVYIATGGLVTGGTADFNALYNYTVDGGITITGDGGTEITTNYTATGGIVVNGSADVEFISGVFEYEADGGLVTGGEAGVDATVGKQRGGKGAGARHYYRRRQGPITHYVYQQNLRDKDAYIHINGSADVEFIQSDPIPDIDLGGLNLRTYISQIESEYNKEQTLHDDLIRSFDEDYLITGELFDGITGYINPQKPTNYLKPTYGNINTFDDLGSKRVEIIPEPTIFGYKASGGLKYDGDSVVDTLDFVEHIKSFDEEFLLGEELYGSNQPTLIYNFPQLKELESTTIQQLEEIIMASLQYGNNDELIQLQDLIINKTTNEESIQDLMRDLEDKMLLY